MKTTITELNLNNIIYWCSMLYFAIEYFYESIVLSVKNIFFFFLHRLDWTRFIKRFICIIAIDLAITAFKQICLNLLYRTLHMSMDLLPSAMQPTVNDIWTRNRSVWWPFINWGRMILNCLLIFRYLHFIISATRFVSNLFYFSYKASVWHFEIISTLRF